ncbi:MAG: MFS transporter, partial [Thermomicrobia bacterium]|nr:MFS transporter [Thermomicrobia bacterium]
ALALGLACFGMSLIAGPLSIFLAFAALRALGQGSMTINATLLAAQWFVRQRGRAMAVVGLGGALSSAVLPPVARALTEAFGWRGAYMALGVMVWVLILPVALFVIRDRPEDMGLLPDGAAAPTARDIATGPLEPTSAERNVLRTRRFWLLVLPMAVPGAVSTALIFHQASIFAQHGLSANLAAAVFVPYAGISACSAILAGFLADRIGPKRIFVANLCLLAGATLLALVIATPLLALLYAAALGVASGMQSIISGVTWAHYYGRRGLGRIQGTATMVTITGAAIGPLPVAYLQQRTGTYTSGVLLMAALALAAAVIVALNRVQPQG